MTVLERNLTALLHYLAGIDSREKMIRSPRIGQNFESFVIKEIIKGGQATSATRWEYFYFQTKHGAEVDLVLEGKFGLLPIEIKFSTHTSPKQVAARAASSPSTTRPSAPCQ